ncbi:MAG: DUF3857 domain-containing protein [Bacteroidia bacterium]|nr:DUF3857 domain-containing protein [Bacteroidia bacterium]
MHTFKHYFLVSSILMLFSLKGFSQSPKGSPFIWGELSEKERNLTKYEAEPNASALILFDYGEWEVKKTNGKNGIGFKAVFHRHIRIKILNENGLDRADVSIPFISGDDTERLTEIYAQTINLEDGLEITSLEKSQIFENDLNGAITEIRFTFPKAKVGSIIEYSYKKTTPNVFTLEPWYFQQEIPTLHSELYLDCARNIDYYILGEQSKEGKRGRYHWLRKDVPSLKVESFVGNMDHYRLGVKFDLKDFKRTIAVNTDYGRTFVKIRPSLYESWKELARDIHPRVRSIPKYQMPYAKSIFEPIIDGSKDTLEWMQKIYEYVRDSIEWNGYYSSKVSRKSTPLLLTRSGSSAEINAFLSDLLNYVGIFSDVVLISTRDSEPYTYDIPRMSQFNHMICAAQVGKELFFLDATDKMRPYDLLDANDLNQYGRLINPKRDGWIQIPNLYSSISYIKTSSEIDPQGSMNIQVTENYRGYSALDLRKSFQVYEEEEAKSPEEIYEETYNEIFPDIDFEDFKVSNLKEPDELLELEYSFESDEFVQEIGDNLYISPLLMFAYEKNPFPQESREHPIDFNYPTNSIYIAEIKIPEGYQVESMPEQVQVKLTNDMASITYLTEETGNKIQIRCDFLIQEPYYEKEAYPYLKQVFDTMIAKHKEKIILKRVKKKKK